MEKPALIDRIIKKYKKEENKQTKFAVKDLYAGEILFFKKHVYSNINDPFDQGKSKFKVIKKFAVLYKIDEISYVHVQSGQELNVLEWAGKKYDYVVRKVKPLATRLRSHEIFGGMADEQILSLTDVKYLERRINAGFVDQKKSFFFD